MWKGSFSLKLVCSELCWGGQSVMNLFRNAAIWPSLRPPTNLIRAWTPARMSTKCTIHMQEVDHFCGCTLKLPFFILFFTVFPFSSCWKWNVWKHGSATQVPLRNHQHQHRRDKARGATPRQSKRRPWRQRLPWRRKSIEKHQIIQKTETTEETIWKLYDMI